MTIAPTIDAPQPGTPEGDAWTLVQRAQAGDAAAFGELYDRYAVVVYRFISFRVGNRHLAQDLAGEVWVRALRRIGSFTWQGRDFGAWLTTIARNLVADHFKSSRYKLEITTGDVLDADREDYSPEGNPEKAVIDHLAGIDLAAAVRELNEHQRRVIVLRFFNGCSIAETAELMGLNEGGIKALQYRAVRTLARNLAKEN